MNTPSSDSAPRRGITFRSVVFGLLGATVLTAFGYYNETVMGMPKVLGNHMPIAIYGFMFIFVLTVNPILGWFHKRLRFSAGELAVAICLMLGAASVVNDGLAQLTPTSLAYPAEHAQKNITYRTTDATSYLPAGVLVNDGEFDPKIIGEFAQGIPNKKGMQYGNRKFAGWSQVPWSAWKSPLMNVLPMAFMILIAGMAMAVIVQPQWRREGLAFPIARITGSLLDGKIPRAKSDDKPLYAQRLFWIGVIAVFAIHLINGYRVWDPTSIWVNLRVNFYGPLLTMFPSLKTVPMVYYMGWPWAYFSVIGIGYFLTREVSLTLGISPIIFVIVTAGLMQVGINPREGSPSGSNPEQIFRFGAYIGLGLIILYNGRRYYGTILRKMFGLLRKESGKGIPAVWGWIFLISSISAIVILTQWGLSWPFAAWLVGAVLLVYLVLARVSAETGLTFMVPEFAAPAMIFAALGTYAIGPAGVAVSALFVTLLMGGVRVAITPLMVNGLQLADTFKLRTGRIAGISTGVMVTAGTCAVLLAVWLCYSAGANNNKDKWWAGEQSNHLDSTVKTVQTLELSDELQESKTMSTWQRVKSLRPDSSFPWMVGLALFLTAGLYFLRFRLPWWPLHPVILVLWGSRPSARFAYSMIIAYVLRTIISKLGGEPATRAAGPLFIGFIVGEVLAYAFWGGIGWGYHFNLNLPPKGYQILRG